MLRGHWCLYLIVYGAWAARRRQVPSTDTRWVEGRTWKRCRQKERLDLSEIMTQRVRREDGSFHPWDFLPNTGKYIVRMMDSELAKHLVDKRVWDMT